jgi:hypothetical protein
MHGTGTHIDEGLERSAAAATSTAAAPAPGRRGLASELDALPSFVRRQMQVIARASSSSDDAQEPIIGLLVAGSETKRAAIVAAFRSNEPLRRQWESAYRHLRGDERDH